MVSVTILLKLHRVTQSAEKLNLATLTLLDDAGVSEEDQYSFISNKRYFNPLKLTENMQIEMLQSKGDLSNNYYDIMLEVDEISKILRQLPVLIGDEITDEKEDLSSSADKVFEGLRESLSKGGLIKGEDNVPFTKENPADRVDPFTGEPYQEQMSRLGFSHGGPHYNNMGNIESRFDYWAGMTGETYGKDGRFGVFDSPISGMRASLRDIKTKQNRYKDTDNPLGHAVAEYLGGGREGTLDQKIQRATGQPNTSNYNPDVQGYINDVVFGYKRDGDEGIIDAIAMREAASKEAANYYIKNKTTKQKAVELATHSFPKGTTTKQMLEFLNSLNN